MASPSRLVRTALAGALVVACVVGAAPSLGRHPRDGAGDAPGPADHPRRGDLRRRAEPRAITRLGAAATPAYHRLMDEGAWTFDARTAVEQTVTLPNHTGMLTSRRIERTLGGHGVTWDDDRLRPRTVQAAARRSVGSVFSRLAGEGQSTAMFATKKKFSLYQRSWPGMDRAVIDLDSTRMVQTLTADLDHHAAGLHLRPPARTPTSPATSTAGCRRRTWPPSARPTS